MVCPYGAVWPLAASASLCVWRSAGIVAAVTRVCAGMSVSPLCDVRLCAVPGCSVCGLLGRCYFAGARRATGAAMASAALAAWMAEAEGEVQRGELFYAGLVEALKRDDVTHWTHLLDVEVESLKSLDTAGKA